MQAQQTLQANLKNIRDRLNMIASMPGAEELDVKYPVIDEQFQKMFSQHVYCQEDIDKIIMQSKLVRRRQAVSIQLLTAAAKCVDEVDKKLHEEQHVYSEDMTSDQSQHMAMSTFP